MSQLFQKRFLVVRNMTGFDFFFKIGASFMMRKASRECNVLILSDVLPGVLNIRGTGSVAPDVKLVLYTMPKLAAKSFCKLGGILRTEVGRACAFRRLHLCTCKFKTVSSSSCNFNKNTNSAHGYRCKLKVICALIIQFAYKIRQCHIWAYPSVR